MKFKLVEAEIVQEKEKLRGQTEAKKVVCSLVQYLTSVHLDPDDWALHHEDRNHDNYSITNLSLVRKSSEHGSSTHNIIHANKKVPVEDVIRLADLL